ncbi:MAG: outer membrane protein assembly factor [Planctomycetota bacterium]|nr:outer membrane protein assembly factor [Planctomycetota bacterium]
MLRFLSLGWGRIGGLALLGLVAMPAPASALSPAPVVQQADERVASPRVVSIVVVGNRRFTQAQLITAFGQPVGVPLSEERIGQGIRTLWTDFHVHADVDYRPVDGGIELRLAVEEMPVDLEPRFVGVVDVDTDQVYEWAGIEQGAELFLHEAPLVRERLIEGYHREGYYFVEVDVVMPERSEVEDGSVPDDVIFHIREGPLVKVTDMVVHGADSFPDTGYLFWASDFQEVADVELDGNRFLWIWRDELVDRTLREDLLAMREVYRNYGWFDAIVELDRLEFNTDRDRVVIHVKVDEGPRYAVGSLAFEMVDLAGPDGSEERPATSYYPLEELAALCTLKEGVPFTRFDMAVDHRALRNHYGDDGYIAHSSLGPQASWRFLEPRLVYDVDENLVHVTYRIVQGSQQFIREVRVKGNIHTQDRVIRRLITVDPGDVADLQEIESSLRRIRGTGFFSDRLGTGTHLEPVFRFIETEDPNWKDLEYEVEEGNDLQFQFTGNFNFDTGLYGGVTVTKSNFALLNLPSSPWSLLGEVQDKQAFHGAGESLSVSLQPGTEYSQYSARWTDPDILRRQRDRVSLTVEGSQNFRFYEPYDEERSDIGFRVGRQVGADSSAWIGFGIGQVKVSELEQSASPSIFSPVDVPLALALQEGTSDLARVDFGYALDTLDSRYVPREGARVRTGLSVYNGALGSDFDFWRLDLRGELYGQFGDEADDLRNGWRLHGGVGVSDAYGDTDFVPYTERFFLGGSGRLYGIRGFKVRGVGPNEKGHASGGSTFLRGGVEYRFPLITTHRPGSTDRSEIIRGALFIDAGVLDEDPYELDFGELRASYGIAFALSVFPQVPITFSFGFPFVDGPGDDKRVFNFSIGF